MPPRLLFALLAALLPPGVHGGEQIFRHDYRDHPDTFVALESVFGAAAKQGALPFRITVRNHSGKARVWNVQMTEGNYGRPLSTQATFRIEVENGAEAVREAILPFSPAFLAYDYRNLTIVVTASGLPAETRSHGEQTPQGFPVLAMSKALAQRSLTRLDEQVKSQNSNDPYFAKLFDPGHLPVDWLGYTGLDALLLDEPAWRSLSSAQRQALVAWVRTGGRLDLYGESEIDPSSLGLPLASTGNAKATHSLSLGLVALHTWDGQELPDSVVDRYRGIPQAATALAGDYQRNWPLQADFGKKEFNPLFVFLLLLAFAILVAPVNLFYLARPGRRHRLFVTTPVISVGTCLLIVLLIFFIDGIGGKGVRVVLADLQPTAGETRLYTTQEQISRTGVMVSPGFETGRPYDLNPVQLPESHFNPFSRYGERKSTYEMGGGRYDGEFFRSRSEQGFLLRSADPSRARIEYRGEEEGTPVLVSNLAQEITALHYRDANGSTWALAAGIAAAPGQRIPLEKTKDTESLKRLEWANAAAAFSSGTRKRVDALWSERNRFFAQVRDPDAFALPTHPGLSWEKTHLLLTGTPAGGPSAPAKSETVAAP